jgi:hypothetical protein
MTCAQTATGIRRVRASSRIRESRTSAFPPAGGAVQAIRASSGWAPWTHAPAELGRARPGIARRGRAHRNGAGPGRENA